MKLWVSCEKESKMTRRREFLGRMAAVGAGAYFPFGAFAWESEKAEVILHNGNIWTVNEREPRAQAIAIARGRILAIGSDAEVLTLAVPATKKIDLGKKTVLPGFIDAHSHPAQAGAMHLRMIDCDLRSIAAIQAALRERAAKTPAGEWVMGFKYDDTKTSDGRALTIADLDMAAPDHPVYIQHRGGHTIYCNSLAMKRSGIDEKKPHPPWGRGCYHPADGKIKRRPAGSGPGPIRPGKADKSHRG